MNERSVKTVADGYSSARWLLLYLTLGSIEWIGLVAVESWRNSNYSGDPYLIGLVITALVFGVVDHRTSHIHAGYCFVAPALALALWTAPQGDNDGLWMLWFPILVGFAYLFAGCRILGAMIRTR